jgi:hypothetical protein
MRHVSFVRTIVKERNRRVGECYNRRLLSRGRMGNTQIIGVAAFQGGIGNRKAKSNNSFCEKLHLLYGINNPQKIGETVSRSVIIFMRRLHKKPNNDRS